MKNTPPTVCWLFCTVIDNFGDIGVSWRLAQQLHQRLGWHVYLWLDDLAALRAIVPDAPNHLPSQHRGIELRAWQAGKFADVQAALPAQIVIETFACDLPDNVLAMIRQQQALWLNWEYLSAEDWAIRTHAMPSLQADGYRKYFWQMGFVPQSGGLLRGITQPAPAPILHRPRKLFAFGYASDVWAKWCRVWQHAEHGIECHIAGQPIWQSLYESGYIDSPKPREHQQGSLRLIPQPFVPQEHFDDLLQQFDWLIIRGEDSFVRAQLSGKPFFWHIYPQDEMAHLDKLHAFWQLVWQMPTHPVQAAFAALSNELNHAHTLSEHERSLHFATLLQHFDTWQHIAQQWQQSLFAQSDAMERLQAFIQKQPAH